ncbi:MAG: hypothetical protein ACLSB9_08730 [Hydrogeniiclostridium mannosilyticum]
MRCLEERKANREEVLPLYQALQRSARFLPRGAAEKGSDDGSKLERFSQKQLQVLTLVVCGQPLAGPHGDYLRRGGAQRKTLCLGLGFITWAFYAFEGRALPFAVRRSVPSNAI